MKVKIALDAANDAARTLEAALNVLAKHREANGGGCRYKAALNLLVRRVENIATHAALADPE
jgi:hypothetical protein